MSVQQTSNACVTIINVPQMDFLVEGKFPDSIKQRANDAAVKLFQLCYQKFHKETVAPLLIEQAINDPFNPEIVKICEDLLVQFRKIYKGEKEEVKEKVEAKPIVQDSSFWGTIKTLASYAMNASQVVQPVPQPLSEKKVTHLTEEMIFALTEEEFTFSVPTLPGYQKLLDKFPKIKIWSEHQSLENAKKIKQDLETLSLAEMETFLIENEVEMRDKIQKMVKYFEKNQRSLTHIATEQELKQHQLQETIYQAMLEYQKTNNTFQSGAFTHDGIEQHFSMNTTGYVFREKLDDQEILQASVDSVIWDNRSKAQDKLLTCIESLHTDYSLASIFNEVFSEKLENTTASLSLEQVQAKTRLAITNRILHSFYLAAQYPSFMDKTMRESLAKVAKVSDKELKVMKHLQLEDVLLIKPKSLELVKK